MKINEIDIMVLKVERREFKDKGTEYLAISFATTDDGEVFNVTSMEMSYIRLEPFNKYTVNLALSNNPKYGMKMAIDEILT